MNVLAESDGAGAREDVIHLVVAVVQVRCPLRDRHDVDVGDAAVAASYDPLNMAERAVDGRDLVTVSNHGLLAEL
jgi:hypothetical protein